MELEPSSATLFWLPSKPSWVHLASMQQFGPNSFVLFIVAIIFRFLAYHLLGKIYVHYWLWIPCGSTKLGSLLHGRPSLDILVVCRRFRPTLAWLITHLGIFIRNSLSLGSKLTLETSMNKNVELLHSLAVMSFFPSLNRCTLKLISSPRHPWITAPPHC